MPATFVAVMGVSGAAGFIDIGNLPAELGIALSLILLGGVIAAERKLPILYAMLTVGFFAIFHGYAHGLEIPNMTDPLMFALGFLTGTALIHIAGVFIGDIASHYEKGKVILRVAGALILVVGGLLLFGFL